MRVGEDLCPVLRAAGKWHVRVLFWNVGEGLQEAELDTGRRDRGWFRAGGWGVQGKGRAPW